MPALKHVMRLSFSMLASLILVSPAHALRFDINGTTAVVSGGPDYPDESKIDDALAAGVNTFVVSDIGGGDIEVAKAVGSYFEDSKATLVINGVCSGVCPDIFISGTVRRFAYPQAGKQGPVFLIRSAVFTGDLSGAANIPDIYARFRPIIGEVISNALLRKHTNGGYIDGALLFFAPSPGEKGNGYVLDCDDLNNIKNTCKLVAGADLLNTNIITAAGPLDLNAPSAAPATQSAPAEKP